MGSHEELKGLKSSLNFPDPNSIEHARANPIHGGLTFNPQDSVDSGKSQGWSTMGLPWIGIFQGRPLDAQSMGCAGAMGVVLGLHECFVCLCLCVVKKHYAFIAFLVSMNEACAFTRYNCQFLNPGRLTLCMWSVFLPSSLLNSIKVHILTATLANFLLHPRSCVDNTSSLMYLNVFCIPFMSHLQPTFPPQVNWNSMSLQYNQGACETALCRPTWHLPSHTY